MAGPGNAPDDEDAGPGTTADAAGHARDARAARFVAEHGDTPLSAPLLIGGVLVLAWWALLAWQAATWWPRPGAADRIAAGTARVERNVGGDPVALVIGEGADARRFECIAAGRRWLVLHTPVVRCEDAGRLLATVDGRPVRVLHDRPDAGGRTFLRLLALEADGRLLWSLDDSVQAFSWQVYRALFAGVLLLVPGLWLHRFAARRTP